MTSTKNIITGTKESQIKLFTITNKTLPLYSLDPSKKLPFAKA